MNERQCPRGSGTGRKTSPVSAETRGLAGVAGTGLGLGAEREGAQLTGIAEGVGKTVLILPQDVMFRKTEYSDMRRMFFFSILLMVAGFTSGCTFQTENSLPVINQPPAISTESNLNFGGTSLAIAFKGDEISTASPEAKERFLKGLTYLTQYGRYNESLQYFDEALAIDPGFSEAWLAKAVAFHNLRQLDDAIRCYDRALELTPQDAGIWHLKGVTLHDYGKAEESAECYRRAAELDPRYGTR